MQSESVDQQLHELALIAKANPQRSRDRQQALAEIYKILQQPGVLKPRSGLHPQVWLEVKLDILVYACEKIDNYDPNKGRFLAWLNGNLKWRQRDAEVEFNRPEYLSLDNPLIFGDDNAVTNWQDRNLQSIFRTDEHPDFLSHKLQTLFEDDPDQKFANSHVRGRPDVTFQLLALRSLHGTTYKDMSEQTKVPVPTLSSFYQRKLAEFTPYIRDYLMND